MTGAARPQLGIDSAARHIRFAGALTSRFSGRVAGHLVALVALAALAALAGCRGGIGTTCRCAADCRAGLVCSAEGDKPLTAELCYKPGITGLCTEVDDVDDSGAPVELTEAPIYLDMPSKRDFQPNGSVSDSATGSTGTTDATGTVGTTAATSTTGTGTTDATGTSTGTSTSTSTGTSTDTSTGTGDTSTGSSSSSTSSSSSSSSTSSSSGSSSGGSSSTT